MEYSTKIVVGLSVLFCCLATTTFANNENFQPSGSMDVRSGGIETEATHSIDITGFNIGVGGGVHSYRFNRQNTASFLNGSVVWDNRYPVKYSSSPSVDVGYTISQHHWLMGVKGFFNADGAAVYTGNTRGATRFARINSHWAAMLFGGVRVDENNAFYLALGYTQANVMLRDTPVTGGVPLSTVSGWLQGVIAAVGWRCYFQHNLYVDVAYNYALYQDKVLLTSLTSNPANNTSSVGIGVNRTEITGGTVTFNYLFNT